MIKVLTGDDFQVQEHLNSFIAKKFKGVSEEEKKFSIIKNPTAISSITQSSAFGCSERLVLWDFDVLKKLEKFNPFIIPKGVDIVILGLDKRNKEIVKSLELFNAEFLDFKPLYSNQVEGWILQKKTTLKIQITPDAVKLLAMYYGTNLSELSNLLVTLAKDYKVIDRDVVTKNSSFVNAFSIFELQDAITARNVTKCAYIYKQMVKSSSQNNAFGTCRYFSSFFQRMIVIKLNDSSMIESLKIHPYILKKLKELRLTVAQSMKALEILRKVEMKILQGIDADYAMLRGLFELCKI